MVALRDAFLAVSRPPTYPSVGSVGGQLDLGPLIDTLIPLAEVVRVIASANSISQSQMAAIDKPVLDFDDAAEQ
jgi:hypothetical protein